MNTQSLQNDDKQFVWHPFTQMKEWLAQDVCIIEKGEGNYLIDTDGNRYLDGVSSLWTNVHGHCKREINDAIKDQLEKIAHSTFLGLSNVPAIELAKKLVAITPKGLDKVFFADSGSAAMEIAIKMAYQYWCQRSNPQPQRSTFIHLKESYHGDTLGSVSIGGIDLFHKVYNPLLFKTIAVPTPYCYRCQHAGLQGEYNERACAKECIKEIEKTIHDNENTIAAIIVEPLMQGAAGMVKQPKGFLSQLQLVAKKYGILLICDEVATGFGRTGKMFACDHENVTPDIMAVGKGITGGYLPLSATLCSEEIFNAFLGEYAEGKAFYHGHTYTGNQLAARAACASIDLFEKENIIERIQAIIDELTKAQEAFYALKHVGEVRQAGLMVGIELVEDKTTKKRYDASARIGGRVTDAARKRGLIIRPLGDVIVLMPPLSITVQEIKTLISITGESIKEITEKE